MLFNAFFPQHHLNPNKIPNHPNGQLRKLLECGSFFCRNLGSMPTANTEGLQ